MRFAPAWLLLFCGIPFAWPQETRPENAVVAERAAAQQWQGTLKLPPPVWPRPLPRTFRPERFPRRDVCSVPLTPVLPPAGSTAPMPRIPPRPRPACPRCVCRPRPARMP